MRQDKSTKSVVLEPRQEQPDGVLPTHPSQSPGRPLSEGINTHLLSLASKVRGGMEGAVRCPGMESQRPRLDPRYACVGDPGRPLSFPGAVFPSVLDSREGQNTGLKGHRPDQACRPWAVILDKLPTFSKAPFPIIIIIIIIIIFKGVEEIISFTLPDVTRIK